VHARASFVGTNECLRSILPGTGGQRRLQRVAQQQILATTDNDVYNDASIHPSMRSCRSPRVVDNYKVYLNVLSAGAYDKVHECIHCNAS
jgi:hypothetical protein